MPDDTPVVLKGKVEKSLGNERYQFNDGTGVIVIEVDNEDWRGLTVTPEDTVEIKGEIEKDMLSAPEVDVDTVSLVKQFYISTIKKGEENFAFFYSLK